MTLEMIVFFAILVVAFGLLISERLRADLVAMLIILALYITRILDMPHAFAGFSAEPAIAIASVFVLSAGFAHTGLSDRLGAWIGRLAGATLGRMVAVLMPASALLSAFTHHVTITAIMLPVTLSLSRDKGISPSKLLMPVAIGSSLGTTITIIGAPSFLVSSELLRQVGRDGLGVFSIAPIGLAITVVGTLFMVLLGRFLLPERRGADTIADPFRLDDYFIEMVVLPESELVGKSVAEVEEASEEAFKVVGLIRHGRQLPSPQRVALQAGDVLLVRTGADALVAVHQEPGIELHPLKRYEAQVSELMDGGNGASGGHGSEPDTEIADRLVQAVVAPGSNLVGRTLGDVDFLDRYGALVVSLWRQTELPTQQMSRIRLREGDVLVLHGSEDALERIGRNESFLMLMPFHAEPLRRRRALVAAAVMLATVAAAGTGVLTLGMATLAGAVAMVLTGCVSVRQAYRAIDARMYLFIAGAIPLGTAMKSTGAADLLAGWLQGIIGGWSEVAILLAVFATVGLVVQFMGSDSATVALFGPVAIALAQALGRPPEPYIVTVAMAAVTAVLTPMSHHNLIIYGPGGYRFTDYMRVGAPLTVLIAITVALIAPRVWPG